ncbi:hypothetical protein WD019_19060 [Fictibacillus sp. Mic-4]|uniref:hypothetical protein n=1 Tax=Fictibacillus TaxID=1329200 RepID=UPI0004238611|nr:hypothetical protein [Fictibacillus gelatini]HAJ3957192.1 hypothetical protein [Escherichia coli]
MKIRELLELTQTMKLADIAKEHLEMGEKPAREALKKAGCYSISGKKGWFFDGDDNVLNQSIYDFAPPKRINRTKAKANVSTNQRKNESSKEPMNEQTLEPTFQRSNVGTEEINQGKAEIATTATKERTNVGTLEGSKVGTKELNKKRTNERSNERTNVVRKRASFDIDEKLLKQLKIQAATHDKTIYEMVETAIKNYLAELKNL